MPLLTVAASSGMLQAPKSRATTCQSRSGRRRLRLLRIDIEPFYFHRSQYWDRFGGTQDWFHWVKRLHGVELLWRRSRVLPHRGRADSTILFVPRYLPTVAINETRPKRISQICVSWLCWRGARCSNVDELKRAPGQCSPPLPPPSPNIS